MIEYIVAWATFVGSLLALFIYLSDGLEKSSKTRIANYIKGVSRRNISDWSVPFANLFDRLFTKDHLSFRCIIGSVATSTVAMFIVLLLMFAVNPRLTERVSFSDLLLGVSLYNFIPDYISLFESRCVLYRMKKSESILSITGYLVLDIILTFFIFAILVSGVYAPSHRGFSVNMTTRDQNLDKVLEFKNFEEGKDGIVYRFDGKDLDFPLDTLIVLPDSITQKGNLQISIPNSSIRVVVVPYSKRPYVYQVKHMLSHYYSAATFSQGEFWYVSIFLYSTFFTSVWVLLYASSTIMIKATLSFKYVNNIFVRHWDIDGKPVKYIGLMSIIIVTIIFAIGAPFIL